MVTEGTGPYHVGVHAAAFPGKPAVIEAETGRTLTYLELEHRIRKLARLLHDGYGLRVGDHIAVLLENRVEFSEVAWAALRTGLYITPLNIQLQVGEAAWIADNCEAKVVIT